MRRVLLFPLLMVLLCGAVAESVPQEVRQAFHDSAFAAEYGDEGADALRRWETAPVLWVGGRATAADIAGLYAFIRQLNDNVPGFPGITLTARRREASVRVVLAPLAAMPELQPGYVDGNWGFFQYSFADNVIYEAMATVASDVTTQAQRDHLLREELVGLLGLSSDLAGFPDSIITQRWTQTRELSALDWQLLALLYDPRLSPGMTFEQASAALGWE